MDTLPTTDSPAPSGQQLERTQPKVTDSVSEDNASMRMPEKPPFQEFQAVLGFVASIGLATTASCAFGLVGVSSSFGDASDAALAEIKRAGVLLAWASACFTVALGFIVAPQLLYTEYVVVDIITHETTGSWGKRVVRVAVGVFAWIPLGFQTAALYLFSQSLTIFAPGPVMLARCGITVAAVLVGCVTLIGMLSHKTGRKKLLGLFTQREQSTTRGLHSTTALST